MKQIDEILQRQLDKNMEFFMKYFPARIKMLVRMQLLLVNLYGHSRMLETMRLRRWLNLQQNIL